jgi:hypothetical protein
MSLRHISRVLACAVTAVLTGLIVVAWKPATGSAQVGLDDLKGAAAEKGAGAAAEGAGAGAQQGTPAGDTMQRLQGAAGVGVTTGAGEAVKGGGLGNAAQKGGAAAVQDYMKGPQGSATPAAPAGAAAPAAGGGAAPEAPAADDSEE